VLNLISYMNTYVNTYVYTRHTTGVCLYLPTYYIFLIMNDELRQITKIFLSGKLSATLIIPIEIARRHGLEKPAHVIVEEKPEGILIRKLEV
jgi:hypothetical protein